MNKLNFLCLLCAVSFLSIYSQDEASPVYGSEESSSQAVIAPIDRTVIGGSVINITYDNEAKWTATQKGALEFACRLWEEKIPTALPINLYVSFATTPTSNLATVKFAKGIKVGQEKVLLKRQALTYGLSYVLGSQIGEATLDYLKAADAEIVFSSQKIFDFSLEESLVDKSKYDFVTVAMQAIGKALGFSVSAFANNSTQSLMVLSPYNSFTEKLLTTIPTDQEKYTRATSGNMYFSSRTAPTHRVLYSPSAFSQGRSLQFFAKDSNNIETLLLQPDIAKGAVVRYIGQGISDFLSYVGWDRDITIGTESSSYIPASTSSVLPYNAPSRKYSNAITRNIIEHEETVDSYIFNRSEFMSDGVYIQLKDGCWERLEYASGYGFVFDLSKNDLYTRTSDGYLKLKQTQYRPGTGGYSNYEVQYRLADFVPQTPKASVNGVISSDFEVLLTKGRQREVFRMDNVSFENNYVDVEVGIQNTEGCESILVEQLDEDFDQPYSYEVDPRKGSFVAYMNTNYTSTLTLSYINHNGVVVGTPLVIDLKQNVSDTYKLKLFVDDQTTLRCSVVDDFGNKRHGGNCPYVIFGINNPTLLNRGIIQQIEGSIDISALPSGIYVVQLVDTEGRSYHEKFVK